MSALVFSAAGNVAALDSESRTVFTAPVKGDEEASVRYAEPARHLGTFTIPSSQGRITFIDETPLAKTPSISIVVVENSWFSTLAEAKHRGASALDLFMEFAPPRTTIPERLKLYADLLRTGDVSGSAEAKTTSTLRLHGASDQPVEGPDTWGAGNCTVKEDWDAGFSNWVTSFPFGFAGFGGSSKLVNIADHETVYSDLGFNDAIWVGVCLKFGGRYFVQMEYKNGDGDWKKIDGQTQLPLHPGERYLYHNFSPYTPQRRLAVEHQKKDWIPRENNSDNSTAFISGMWKDNFAPDSTEAAP